MEDVILTPFYENTVYQYHECSNCKEKLYFEEDRFVPFYFKENIKYCPFCGKKVIRYANPQYLETPDWSWLEEFEKIIDKTYRFLEYKIHCKMSEESRKELIDKTRFGEKYFGKDWYPISNGNVCNLLNYIAREKLHYSSKNKLKEEFEKREEK